jgi:dihydroorotate dehydrogenase (NAD+) catalytic subunit
MLNRTGPPRRVAPHCSSLIDCAAMKLLRSRSSHVNADVDMRVRVGSVELMNPVMGAAGTVGHGAEFVPFGVQGLGAVVVKSVSPEPWAGNPSPRVAGVDAGMINAVGLQNPGVAHWITNDLPALRAAGATVVASIWGFTVEQYRDAAAALAGVSGIAAVEVNVSCPNIEDRRSMFGHSCGGTTSVISEVVRALSVSVAPVPVWAKLSPNVTDITEIAGAALDAGAAALTLTNTVMGLVIDTETGKPALGNGGGGVSGPAIRPVALRAVNECRKAFPTAAIIGVGGIAKGIHAVEFLMAGANAVQVGTAHFYDPRAGMRVRDELAQWCAAKRTTPAAIYRP